MGRIDVDAPDQELAAEPVPELREALQLRPEELVVLSRACYGLIDAPRRWWKALVHDQQGLKWRCCHHEPCLMALHDGKELIGLVCFHVDDVMVAGNENNPRWLEMRERIAALYEWG